MMMSLDVPIVSRARSHWVAGAMALGVHVIFLLLLVFGVSWQTQHPAPVMVDLWEAMPAPPKVEPAPDVPKPAKSVPAPPEPPVARDEPSPKAPDIALEKKKAETERLKKQEALRAAETRALAESARVEAEAVKKKREQQRQQEQEEVAQRVAAEVAANEARFAKQAEARAAASKRQSEVSSMVGVFRDKISAAVRGNTRLPDGLVGNPEVRCQVRLLPTGEVLSVRVTQPSGNTAYDEAVVRAIKLSSPLPLPAERDARATFVPELLFVHRPKE
jgi:colicin import membrane protein